MNECVWDGTLSSTCETGLHCSHMTSLFREWIPKNTYFAFILPFLAQTSKLLTVKKDIESSPRSHRKREVKRIALWVFCTVCSAVYCIFCQACVQIIMVLHEQRTQYTSHTNTDEPGISPEGPSNACSPTLTCVCSQTPDPSHYLLRRHEKTRLNQSAPSAAHKLTASVNEEQKHRNNSQTRAAHLEVALGRVCA